MNTTTDPYGSDAYYRLKEIGGTAALTQNDGTVVDPFFFSGAEDDSDRAYLELSGDMFHEMRAEGIYDEGIHWAELDIVRFSFKTSHPVLGDLSICHDATRGAARGALTSAQPHRKFPAIHRARFHLTMTASSMPGVVLQNQGLPIFLQSDELPAWPFNDALYRFKFQVPFERRDNPGDIVVMLRPGAMRMHAVT